VIILHNTLLFQEYYILLPQIQFLLTTLHVLEIFETLLFASVKILHASVEIFVSSKNAFTYCMSAFIEGQNKFMLFF